MTFVVTENCINCKFQDCVSVCPVDCFYEGENFLVIHPEECIDCGVCEPECPADAIKPDTEQDLSRWLEINTKFSRIWSNITQIGTVPVDAEEWNGKPDKASLIITGHEPETAQVQKPTYEAGNDVERSDRLDNGYEVDGVVLESPKLTEGGQVVELEPRLVDEDGSYEFEGLSMQPDDKS